MVTIVVASGEFMENGIGPVAAAIILQPIDGALVPKPAVVAVFGRAVDASVGAEHQPTPRQCAVVLRLDALIEVMQHDVLPRASGQRELEHGACIVAPAAEGGAVDHVGLRIDQELALGPAVVTAEGLAGGFERMEQLVRPLLVAGAAQTEYGSTIVLAALAGVAIERTIRTEDDARIGALLGQWIEVMKDRMLPLGLAHVERAQTKHFGAGCAIDHVVLDRQRACRLA